MNLNYQKIYNQYSKLPYYLTGNDIFGFGPKVFFADLEKEFMEEVNLLAKKKFPKKKKVDYTVLSEEEILPVKEKYQRWINVIWRRKVSQSDKLKNLLYANADFVEISQSDEFSMVHSSRASNYRSQGCKNKYAKSELDKYIGILAENSIQYEIRERPEWNSSPCDSYEYQLWAKIELWQWDALLRRTKYSVLDWAVRCWQQGVNPRVYNPYLSNEIWDESLKIFDQNKK